jgi:hypothetical protein
MEGKDLALMEFLYPSTFLGLQRAITDTLNLVVKCCGRDLQWLLLEYKSRIP